MPQPSSLPRRIVVISDFQDGPWEESELPDVEAFRREWLTGHRGLPDTQAPQRESVAVDGGYIERLPLACLKAGLADTAEIWTHWRAVKTPPPAWTRGSPHLLRRAFRMNGPEAPFASNDMLGHIAAFGPPEILCVWGLGVSEEILEACRDSIRIYNSIDAPALRIPPDRQPPFRSDPDRGRVAVAGGAEPPSRDGDRHHARRAGIRFGHHLPPARPAEDLRRHLCGAAQAYKRHDILFDALAKLPRSIRALCVCGYGELTEHFATGSASSGSPSTSSIHPASHSRR